jgi:hypothetical protein
MKETLNYGNLLDEQNMAEMADAHEELRWNTVVYAVFPARR